MRHAPDLPHPAPADDRGRLRFRVERDLGEVLSATFAFLRETWRELGRALLLVAGPVLLLTAVGSYFFQSRLVGAMGEAVGEPRPDPRAVEEQIMGAVSGPDYAVSLVGGLIAATLVTALVLGYVRLYRAGAAGTVTPGALWAEASHHVVPVLALTGLAALFAMAAGVLLAGGGLGLLAWVLLALYVLPLVALALAARVPGGRDFGSALAEARGLLRRHWGATVGVLLVASLVWYACSLVLSLPTIVAATLTMLNAAGAAEPSGGLMRVLMAVGTLLGTFSYLLYAIPLVAAVLHYYSLREREEGGGLAARVDLLGGPLVPPREPGPPAEGPPPAPPPLPPPAAPPPAAPPRSDAPRPGFRGRGFDDEA